MKKLSLTLLSVILAQYAIAQCTVNANAVVGITLQCNGGQGQMNRSAVAFNPMFNLYYSVDAGSSGYPIETFDITGASVANTTQGFDYRGMWWNPNTSQLVGNGYATNGVVSQDLNIANGHPLGTVTNLLSAAQPDDQSDGDYDYDANEIVYYFNGAYHRYDGTTNTFIGTVPITGLPVPTSNLNSNTAFYTGCTGMEYGVYDHVNKRFYFIDKATGAYVATSQLPVNAPAAQQFQASYANGKLWLFDNGYIWRSYEVLQACPAPPATITPSGTVTACMPWTNSVLLTANTGTGYTYQWKENGVDIPGATLSTYEATIAGNYTVVVTDNGCSQTSAATVIVFAGAPQIIMAPSSSVSVCADAAPVTLSATSVPSGAIVDGWLQNGSIMPGMTTNVITTSTSGTYSIIMSLSGCADTASVNVTISPNPVPVIVQNGNVLSTTQTYQNYSWAHNSTVISTNPTCTVGPPGNYTVTVWDNNNCEGTSAIFNPVSVTNILVKDLAIYPNPSNGSFLIKGHININGNKVQIKVTDITGRLITEEEVDVKSGSIEKKMELPHLSAGTYMLFITSGNGQQVVPILIK